MNIFAEGIVRYDHSVKVESVHNIKVSPPLPQGSFIKKSRCKLYNDEQLTPELFDQMRRELFIDCRHSSWVKDGIFIHVFTSRVPIITSFDGIKWDVRSYPLWMHGVNRESYHLIEQQDEYEWWQLTEEEEHLLDSNELVV